MTTEKTILLVDDDPNILAVAGFAVAKAGFCTIATKNGKEGHCSGDKGKEGI